MAVARWIALFFGVVVFLIVMLLPGVTTRAVDRLETQPVGATAVTLLLREEEETRIHRGPRQVVYRLETLTRWNVEIAGNDVTTAQLRWWRSLAMTYDRDVARRAKILGVDGGRIWILADQLYGVDATTGEVVADTARIEAAAPALRGLIPTESKYFDRMPISGALLVTAADGRVWRLDATTLTATPPVDELTPDEKREHQNKLARWSMQLAFGTGPDDFKINGDIVGDGWVGMIADEEAKDIGPQWTVPSRSASTPRRRRLWRARVSYVDSIVTGRTPQVSDSTPVDGAAEFLTGGLLRFGDRPVPVTTTNPDGFLVLHTDRLGDDGRYLLSRIDAAGQPRWTDALPLKRIEDVWATDSALTLVGPERRPDDLRGSAVLVGIDLASGRCGAFDFRTVAMLPTDCAS